MNPSTWLWSISVLVLWRAWSLPELIWEGLLSLQTIDIVECGGLKSLLEGIRRLTSLEVLTIHGCSALKKRCEEETGEDWYKTAHIPKLLIW
ncbi:unnamed protein product [Lathyrus sativus]|nr:unnamed protein product [Lathyrus sativus]